jgi:hypothetical protein
MELTRRYTPAIRRQIAGVPLIEREENEDAKSHTESFK